MSKTQVETKEWFHHNEAGGCHVKYSLLQSRTRLLCEKIKINRKKGKKVAKVCTSKLTFSSNNYRLEILQQ